jgi:hypothetical protein
MSRSPWLWFVLIGLVPALLLSGNVLGSSVALVALFPAVAAMLVLSSEDEPEPLPEYLTRRLLVAAGVVVVLVGARLAWTGLHGLVYKLLVTGAAAALTAWVLSGMYAPPPAVRRWVRSLVATGAPRAVVLVAALVWPLVTGAAVVVSAALPDVSIAAPHAESAARLLLILTVSGVFAAALTTLAWYGFVANRLAARLVPLATGLLIGVVQWLVVWGLDLWPLAVPDRYLLVRLAGSVATAVVAVWALERSRGSLLPVWLLGATLAVAQAVASLTVVADDVARTDTLHQMFVAGQLVVALVLVVSGRMWRRPAGT